MTRLSFSELVDIETIRHFLETQYKITGILSAILDTDENILIAVGWQEICTRFHRCHPVAVKRCRESDARIKASLRNFSGGYLDYRCGNGLRDVAVPIVIGGEHLATFFTGQFFYDDEVPDIEYFRNQAAQFGFDETDYLAALGRVPVCSRDQIRNVMDYCGNLVQMLAELGMKNLELTREVEQRKQAEEALQESRDYLDKIINSIADPIFVKDREHRLVLVNDAECALIGRSREDVIGRTDYDFFPGEQVDIFWEKDEAVFTTGLENLNEEEITDGNGNNRVVATKKSLYVDRDGGRYIVGIIRDITERARTEKEASFFRFLVENTHDPVYVIDPMDGWRLVYVNQAACSHFGRTFAELLTMRIPDWDPAFDMENIDSIWEKLKREKSLCFETQHRLISGELVPVEVSANYLEHDGRELSSGHFRIISDRKAMEAELRQSEQNLLDAQQIARVGNWVLDLCGNVVSASDECRNILSVGHGELPGTFEEFLEYVYPANRTEVRSAYDDLREKHVPCSLDFRIICPDATEKFVHANGKVAYDNSGEPHRLIGTVQDISDHVRVMEALREKDQLLLQQSRLATMGEMINYIAHQWRQPLNSIGILVQELKDEYDDGLCSGAFMERTVGRIMNILQHMSCTIDDFRDFFKTGKQEEQFSLNEVTRKTLSFVSDSLKAYSIKVDLEIQDELTIIGYPNEYLQVLLNILNNAREALVERRIESPAISIRLCRENGKAVTSIGDNAGGISPDIIGRIFESYFTTREKGTGIGLYMSKTIIEKRMKGRITVANANGGAEFRIEFPN